jgi:AraC-like DNA-binding protein
MAAPRALWARDPDEAQSALEPLFADIRLRVHRRDDVNVRMQSAAVGSMWVHRFGYGPAPVSAIITPLPEEVQVTLPYRGGMAFHAGPTSLTTDADRGLVLSTSTFDPEAALWFDKPATIVRGTFLRIPMALMRAVVGEAELVFRPDLDTRTPGARAWMRMVRLLNEELDMPRSPVTSSLSASAFGQLIASVLLETQPNSFVALDPTPHVAPGRLRRAVAAMNDAPERPWTVAELAQLAHCSPRSLQMAFRGEFGHGPLEHLRRIRLARVHEDLMRFQPGTITVGEIADSWGFSSLGRFASYYRQVYGQLPSVTLAS